jgi:phage terminase large subunit-like protein
MSDEIEEGPDPNGVRRHAKKMLTEIEYRRQYRRIDHYRPNPKQLEFHNLIADERMLRGGNQQGKTHGGGAGLTFDALGFYPGWYQGRRFLEPPPIERPVDFLAWVASTTSITTRDGAQTKLLGDIRQQDGLGTGLIPLDNIVGRPTMARGIADFVDTVNVRREGGGRALIRFKTFEMDRKAFQGESVDEIWLDEDPGDDVVYGECLARITATRGQIIFTATPTLGVTPVRKRFKERMPGTAEVLMTIDDATHIPAELRAAVIARYKASERATRAYGADMQGEGAVFEIPEEAIKHNRDPATFPPYWAWLWAVDFSHGGMSASAHPFAAVLAAWDRDNDTIYVIHAIRMRQSLPINHVAAIKGTPAWEAPVAWPHDGGHHGFESGETFAATYKRLGLNMRPTHATFRDGGYNFESGITEIEQRLATGRLKIAQHLTEVFDEYRGYHRVNGLVHKVDDDLLSAIRVLCMDIRFAKTADHFSRVARPNDPRNQFARGTPSHPDGSFDVFGGGADDSRKDFDIFTGR